jgi:hypothetical protein
MWVMVRVSKPREAVGCEMLSGALTITHMTFKSGESEMQPDSDIGTNLPAALRQPLPAKAQDALDAAVEAATVPEAAAYDAAIAQLIAVTGADQRLHIWTLIDAVDAAATGWRIATAEAAYRLAGEALCRIGRRGRRAEVLQ